MASGGGALTMAEEITLKIKAWVVLRIFRDVSVLSLLVLGTQELSMSMVDGFCLHLPKQHK